MQSGLERSEKIVFFINFLQKYLQLLDIPVFCTANKRSLLVISKIISVSGFTDVVCNETFKDSD